MVLANHNEDSNLFGARQGNSTELLRTDDDTDLGS